MIAWRLAPALGVFVLSLLGQDTAHETTQAVARLHGHVVDETNAPLSGAEVIVVVEARERRAFADPTGAFTLDVPKPGEYSLRVALPGYFDLRGRKVQINSGSNDISLILNRVRERLESLDVSGTSSVIEMDRTAPEERLTSAELLEVPYKTNNDLRNSMRVLPAVIQDSHGGVHVNGGSEQQVLYTLDGFNITDPLTGTFQSRLGVDAVQAMTVLSGAVPAEYGKGAAGIVAVNTKTGDDVLRYSATNFIPGVEYRKGLVIGSFTPRLSLSGPIRKGKIWFSDTLATQLQNDVVRDLPAGQDRSSSWRISNMLRAQVNLTPSNILYSGLLTNFWVASRTGLGALDPLETTVDRRARQWFYDIKDQIYLGRGSLLEAGFSTNRTFGRQIPQGHDLYSFTANGRRGNYFADGIQQSTRDQLLANYFFPSFTWAGGHQLKMGIDLDRLSYWQDVRRTGFREFRADSTIAREVLFGGNGRLGQGNYESSVYLEDTWRVRPSLLLELGIRADRDTLLRNWSGAPRVGFAWSPWGLQHTKVSGGFGIIYNATNLGLFTRPADQYPITTFYPQGSTFPYSGVSTYLIDRHLHSPRYQNFNLGIEQEMPAGFYARIQSNFRRGSHGLSYFDTTELPLVGLTPGVVYQLQDGRRDQFKSVEFTLRQNLRKQYEWLASYTRSRSTSNSVIDLNADQPLLVPRNSGPLPWDSPNRILSWGLLPTFWKSWAVAYLAEWHSGFPFSIQDERGLVLGKVNSDRYPNFFEVNLHVERQFELRGQRWAWRMGLNNITGRRNPDVVNNRIESPHFLNFYGGQGRAVNVRIRWLGKS